MRSKCYAPTSPRPTLIGAHEHLRSELGKPAIRGLDWDPRPVAFEPSTQEYDGFYRLKLITAGLPPSQKGGRTAQKGSPPLPYTSLQAALRLHPCRALSSAEAGRSLYPAGARAQRRHDITAR
jgi:hypothetical protein